MQPPADKRFYRGSNRLIAGVCSGLADGFHVDPMWVRLAFVLMAFLQGIGVLVYIVLWAVMPERAAGQAGGRSGLELKRAWAELKAQFSGSPTITSPVAPPPTGAAPPSPQVTAPASAPPAPAPSAAPVATTSPNAPLLLGLVLLVIGFAVLANNFGFTNWQLAWPAALIALGIFLLLLAMGRKA